eukprot:CAMPEP_0175989808 /NCGR_PEP_ID=MMETSP0108-20121206/51961_1 /TAXON_ID=195067 ORGANISM="Goniomonas pacifica, Strain CCMP1869" /NCGR_SAMPLE_ID=MMETSP0108 /ASSEMBLY_ACC=CAM_ASM_000204 /LENGTH=114 /DNA_ID=CAMNT_0017321219 /DNA_START=195 /DNA_END=539 /DNA_ORIENTATION=-
MARANVPTSETVAVGGNGHGGLEERSDRVCDDMNGDAVMKESCRLGASSEQHAVGERHAKLKNAVGVGMMVGEMRHGKNDARHNKRCQGLWRAAQTQDSEQDASENHLFGNWHN